MIQKLTKWFKNRKVDFTDDLYTVAISATVVTTTVVIFNHLGILQPLELVVFDKMVIAKPDEGVDSRLLVVAITEEDIQHYKESIISDYNLAKSLANIQKYQPAVIGVDVYRDIPQGEGLKLLEIELKKPNVISIAKMGNTGHFEVPPPPAIPLEQIGFNDLIQDSDGVVRRNLLFGNLDQNTTLFSFGLQLVLAYLKPAKIEPINDPNNPNLITWGKAQFTPLEPNSGGYAKIDTAGYQILLNYRSRKSVKIVSLQQILNNQVNPDLIKDKIVIIGYTASTKRDLFLTPYSGGEKQDLKMPGVIIHAQIISQILSAVLGERPLFWYWSKIQEILWIGFWAVAGGLVVLRLRHPFSLVLKMISFVIIIFASGFYLFLNNGWIPIVSPLLSALLTNGLAVTYSAYQAQLQKKIVMNILGKNTSPEVADALWKNRDKLMKAGKLPGQKITATMLFTDLKNFSTVSEEMAPEALMEWLNEYLGILAEIVHKNKGIINKFTGDGIMAAFGVPVERTSEEEIAEDARHAVDSALEFAHKLDEMNQEWGKNKMPVVQMRVGIFTGPVVAGSLGGKDRQEYGIIGDSVNIASRLESCEKDRQEVTCRILIGKETLVYIGGDYEVESWGAMALKGKHQNVNVYRVKGKKISN